MDFTGRPKHEEEFFNRMDDLLCLLRGILQERYASYGSYEEIFEDITKRICEVKEQEYKPFTPDQRLSVLVTQVCTKLTRATKALQNGDLRTEQDSLLDVMGYVALFLDYRTLERKKAEIES